MHVPSATGAVLLILQVSLLRTGGLCHADPMQGTSSREPNAPSQQDIRAQSPRDRPQRTTGQLQQHGRLAMYKLIEAIELGKADRHVAPLTGISFVRPYLQKYVHPNERDLGTFPKAVEEGFHDPGTWKWAKHVMYEKEGQGEASAYFENYFDVRHGRWIAHKSYVTTAKGRRPSYFMSTVLWHGFREAMRRFGLTGPVSSVKWILRANDHVRDAGDSLATFRHEQGQPELGQVTYGPGDEGLHVVLGTMGSRDIVQVLTEHHIALGNLVPTHVYQHRDGDIWHTLYELHPYRDLPAEVKSRLKFGAATTSRDGRPPLPPGPPPPLPPGPPPPLPQQQQQQQRWRRRQQRQSRTEGGQQILRGGGSLPQEQTGRAEGQSILNTIRGGSSQQQQQQQQQRQRE